MRKHRSDSSAVRRGGFFQAARSGFANTEYVVVTEKLHGSSARFLFLDGVFYIGSHFQCTGRGSAAKDICERPGRDRNRHGHAPGEEVLPCVGAPWDRAPPRLLAPAPQRR